MQKEIQQVKIRLLQAGYLDNEWLDKYLKIIEDNLSTKLDHTCTQSHHAIPVRTYYNLTTSNKTDRKKALKIANNDPENIKVNLLYKDHLLAHSYLTLCLDLEQEQLKYEQQASLRQKNSHIGAAAYCTKYKRSSSLKYDSYKTTDTLNYLQDYYSAEESLEIYNL